MIRIVVLIWALQLSAGCASHTAARHREAPATAPTTQFAASEIRVRLAIPEWEPETPVDLHVVIENISQRTIGIIDEWNSWGYFSVQLDFTLPDGKHLVASKSQRDWTRNFFSITRIQPGDVFVRDVILSPDIWENLPDVRDGTVVGVRVTFSQERYGGFPELATQPAFRPAYERYEELAKTAWVGSITTDPVQIRFRRKTR